MEDNDLSGNKGGAIDVVQESSYDFQESNNVGAQQQASASAASATTTTDAKTKQPQLQSSS